MSLLCRLREVFRKRRHEIALSTDRAAVSYAELEGLVRGAVCWLRQRGIGCGDRIAVQMTPGLESVALFLAGLFSGAILVPLNPRATPAESRFLLEDAGASLWIGTAFREDSMPGGQAWNVFDRRCPAGTGDTGLRLLKSEAALLAAWGRVASAPWGPDPDPDQTALLCYTSGTTGRPKGAMLSRNHLLAQAESLHQAWAWTGGDALLHALPLFHVHGLLVALLGALFAGARTVLLPAFDPDLVLDRLVRERCTIFMGVPTMYHRLLAAAVSPRPDLSRVRLFVSGSAPLRPEVLEAFEREFGHTILERYGMTEAGMVLSNPLRGLRKPGSVGVPLPGVAVRLVEPGADVEVAPGGVGEVNIRSRSLFKGYWGMPEADREVPLPQGWFRSGDLARQDQDGYFRIVGRCRELIITGGFNVYPREVETVLESHPAVAEAAVFGQPDPDLGERVCAAVVPARTGISDQDLRQFCRETLAAYKCPRTIRFLPALPRNSMGKVLKGELGRSIPSEATANDG